MRRFNHRGACSRGCIGRLKQTLKKGESRLISGAVEPSGIDAKVVEF